MGKNQSASGLTNVIQYNNGNITFVSGSTTLMSISSSGAITTTGVISGSNALSASYAANADTLDGLDSTAFATTGAYSATSGSLYTVSSSAYATSGSLSATSGSLSATSGSLNTRVSALEATGSALSSSILSVSSSAYATSGSLSAASGSFNTRVATIESKYATTGSNNFRAPQYVSDTTVPTGFSNTTGSIYTDGGLQVTKDSYFSSSMYIKGNLTIYGTQSVAYITSSQLNIATNLITVNTATPSVRFGGLAVYDSGSTGTGATGSLFWDSQNNGWVYQRESGSTYSGGMLISGPRRGLGTNLGDEQGTTACMVMVGQGGDHITSSLIYHDSTVTCIPTPIVGGSTACFASTICSAGAIFTSAVGVNTTSITDCLTVVGTTAFRGAASNTQVIQFEPSSTGAGGTSYIYSTYSGTASEGPLGLGTYSCKNAIHISPTGGKVGIGTTTPGRKLEVYAVDPAFALKSCTTTGYSELYFADSTSDAVGYISYAHSTDNMVFGTGGTTRLTINGSGITCFASSVCAANLISTGAICSSGDGKNLDIGGVAVIRGNGSAYQTHYFTTGAVNVAAYYQYNASGTSVNKIAAGEHSYFNSGCNFGIGTATPGVPLDIQAVGVVVKMKSTTGTNSTYTNYENTAGNFYVGRDSSTAGSFGGSNYAAVLYSSGNYPIEFWTNGARRLNIDGGGNVGFCTTSPATRIGLNSYVGARLPYINGTGNTFDANGITVGNSNNGNTNIGGGIDFTNNCFCVGAYSPILSFSSVTTNYAYNNAYAGIWGVFQGAGGDANWGKGDLVLGTAAAYGIYERMRITSTGCIGIGSPSPNAPLDVTSASSSSSGIQQWSYNTSPNSYRLQLNTMVCVGLVRYSFDMLNAGASYNCVLTFDRGMVGVGGSPTQLFTIKNPSTHTYMEMNTVSSAYAAWILYSAGGANKWLVGLEGSSDNYYLYNTVGTAGYRLTLTQAGVLSTTGGGTSDCRVKHCIQYLCSNTLPIINQLKPVSFIFNEDVNKQTRHGFIAQDVLNVKPDLVLGDGACENGTYGLDYDGIIALLVKGMQEQQCRITLLESCLGIS